MLWRSIDVSLKPKTVIKESICGRGLVIFRMAVCRLEKVPGLSMNICVGFWNCVSGDIVCKLVSPIMMDLV